ncbi:MAG: hypothetical protein GPJ52_04280 [Candidatus Heimdallarchaeota archaeon]|nr:hypothetical protein [Candidatus Heimdallarchaeota archaeon]
MDVKNFYRFNITYEQSVFNEMKEDYFGLTISAHLILFYEKFFSTFLRELDKPFFIDTVSYVFARDLVNIKKIDKDGNLALKKSYQKLVNYCNGNIKTILDTREFIPKDFFDNNGELINEFSNKLISFQKDFFSKNSIKAFEKYSKILDKPIGSLNPLFLTTPYFYFDSMNDPWYRISLKMAQASISLKEEFDLYAIICFSKELLLNFDITKKIVKDYSEFDGYIIWISDFDEKIMSPIYLSGLVNFIEKLGANGKPIYNLYGEYFSLLLSKMGLSGYSRGLGFSEKKFVDACVTGGGQPKRYYNPLLHYSVSETAAIQFYSVFPKLLCNCEICQSIRKDLNISNNPSLKDIENFFNQFNFTFDSKKHLVNSHAKEINDIAISTIKEIIIQLKEKVKFYENNTLDIYSIRDSHLKNWLECLIKYSDL